MLNWGQYLEKIELILFITFLLFYLIQVFYYLRFYLPVPLYKKKTQQSTLPLSIIICARNEAENLKKNLPFIFEQKYPEFEVIVVNDCSTDNTDEVLGNYLSTYKNLRTTTIPPDKKFYQGKKLALTVGIKAASNENLIFTDADCKPVSEFWLEKMGAGFKEKDIILGYGGYFYKKSFLNNFIRFESVFIALNYLGFALAKKPYMGVGRNLAYKKSLFFKNKGFASNYGILSGDDDLFINEVATSTNTTINLDPESFTRTGPRDTWNGYFIQKLRHLTTFNSYKPKHIFLLGLEPISRAWFYTLLIMLICLHTYWKLAVLLAFIRWLIQLIVFIKAGHKLKEKNLWLTFYIFDIYSLFFNFVVYLTLSLRRKKIRWK